MLELIVNGRAMALAEHWREERLLDALRDGLGLVGAKLGCGAGQCGACTVLLDGAPLRSCSLRTAAAVGHELRSIEGLAQGNRLHAVQQAWLDERVAQCGYCQSGQMMAAVALLEREPRPTPAQIDAVLAAHLCRCGTQLRARQAVLRASGQ